MSNAITFLALTLILVGCATVPTMSAATLGDVERGAQLFAQGHGETPPCATCHQVAVGQFGFSIAPNLVGIAERAGTQVEGLTAREYLQQSIVEPKRYIVSGYRDMMYPDYTAHLTEQDIQDLIAYLLTL